MNVGELFISLGFSVDDKKLKDFNDRIGAGTKAITAMAAGAAAAVYGVNRFINSAVNQSVQLTNLNNILGLSTQEIKSLEYAGQQFNASFTLDDAIETWTKFFEFIEAAKLGDYSEEMLRLNIGNIAYDQPLDILMKLRNSRDRSIDRNQWTEFARRMGLEPLIPLLESSDSDFNAAMSMPVPNPSDIEAWNDVAKAINNFKRTYDNAKMGMGGDLAPNIIEFLKNSMAIIDGLGIAIDWLSKKFGSSLNSIKMFATYIGFVGGAIVALFVPLAWIPLGITAILVAWNTLGATIRGNSWISAMLDGLMAIPDAIKNSIEWFQRLFEKISQLGDKLKDSVLLKFLNLFVSERGSAFAKLKQNLEEKGIGKANGIVPSGGIGGSSQSLYNYKGYPPMPAPVAPMEQQVTIAPNYNINTTANPRDMWDSLNMHEQYLIRNAMLDQMYGASGLKTGGM